MTESPDDHQASHGIDPDLVGLVQLADAYGLEYPLVLTLSGQVLDGTLIGGRAFATDVADVVQGEDPDETLRGALAQKFRQRADDLSDFGATSRLGDLDPEGADHEDLPPMPDVQFVHLRHVTVSTASADRRLPLWRGRLDQVAGWTLGGFEDVPTDD